MTDLSCYCNMIVAVVILSALNTDMQVLVLRLLLSVCQCDCWVTFDEISSLHQSMDDDSTSPLLRSIPGLPGSRSCKVGSCLTISIAQGLERIAYYGLAANLITLVKSSPLAWQEEDANSLWFYFIGLTSITSIFAGYTSDAFIRRIKVIFVGYALHFAGLICMIVLGFYMKRIGSLTSTELHALNSSNHKVLQCNIPVCADSSSITCLPFVYVSSSFIAIGSSIMKTNLVVFGADQVSDCCTNNS